MWIEAVILLVQLSAQSPQSKPTEPPSREALARLLAKSHHEGVKLPEMVSFTATLKVAEMGRDKEHIEVTLASWFRKDVPRGSRRRPMPMIRYSLDEGGKRLERGRDAYGYWYRAEGKVTPLDDAEGTTDRDLVKQQISLAKQLLSVVNPADVLQRLTGKVKVADGTLPFGKSKTRYWIATGKLGDYPFYTLPQEKRKQREASLLLYVDKTTGMLKAVQATHTSTGNRELVLFGEYGQYPLAGADQTNVSLPTVLKISRYRGGKYEPLVKITIAGVNLNPKLTAADFQRQR